MTYKLITDEFIKFYYGLYDTNFIKIGCLYTNYPCITFADEEFNNFMDLYKKITKDYNIHKFNHKITSYSGQPIGDKLIIISINGTISINNNYFQEGKFSETICLIKDNDKYYINNSIFNPVQ